MSLFKGVEDFRTQRVKDAVRSAAAGLASQLSAAFCQHGDAHDDPAFQNGVTGGTYPCGLTGGAVAAYTGGASGSWVPPSAACCAAI